VSAWIWGLLARLPGRGELVSEEVGVVRELGKRAVWVGVEMKGVDMGGLEEQMEEGGEDDGNQDEEIMDVEVDGEDELPNSDVGDEGFPEGGETLTRDQHYDASESRNPDSSPDRPIIGPVSPGFLRSGSSRRFNPITGGSVSENPTTDPQDEEDAALATARARLLARLGPHPEPQPLIADDIQTLLEGKQEVTSLPNTNAHEAREKLAALQKQLDKLISARERQKDHPLRQELEEEVRLITRLVDLQRCEVKSMEDAESRRKDKDAADAGNDAPGSEDGEWAGDAADKHLEGEDGGAMDDEQDAKEEQGDDRPSAIQAAKVLLDIIVTIAGEVYGQRDLLEFREVWE